MCLATTWEKACKIRSSIEGRSCSQQTLGVSPLIRDADRLITPALQDRIRKRHPEARFTIVTGTPMARHNWTPPGRTGRLKALMLHFPEKLDQSEGVGKRGLVTDALDAYALLWTAR